MKETNQYTLTYYLYNNKFKIIERLRILTDSSIITVMGYRFEPKSLTFKASKLE